MARKDVALLDRMEEALRNLDAIQAEANPVLRGLLGDHRLLDLAAPIEHYTRYQRTATDTQLRTLQALRAALVREPG